MSVPTPILQYNLSDASVKGLLPNGYTPLAYVEFTNANRLINTGITPNNNLKFESKWGNLTNGGLLYGSENSSDISSYASISNGYNWRWGGLAPSPTPVIDTGIFIVELSKDGIKINGVTKSTYSGTPSFTNTAVYLFGRSNNSAYLLTGKCYYFKIWNNGSLVRDFIPCINSSNVVGLYDLVGRLFYSPSSNVLKAGPELAIGKNGGKSLPEEYLLVEYLESHGNANSPCLNFTNRTLQTDDIVQINTSLNSKTNNTLPSWLGGGNNVQIYVNSSGSLSYWQATNVEAVSPASGTSITLNQRYVIKSKIKTAVSEWRLFDYNINSYPINGRIEMMSVTRGTSVIVKLIPCYRKSDMKPGMYDVVNGEFKTSATSGEFILGPSITNCYTWEPNAGSGTLQGLYNNISGIYDSSKGWVAGFNNSCLVFNNPISLSSNFSISCWLDLTNINSTQYFIGFADGCGIRYGSDNIFLYYNGGLTLTWAFTKVNRFVHVVFTCTSNSIRLYIDGNLIGNAQSLSSPQKNCIELGRRSDGYYYNGKLYNFMIFNTALTAAQVKELYGK